MNQMMRQLGISSSGGPAAGDQWDQPPSMPIHSMDDKEAWNAWGQQMKRWGQRMQQQGGGRGWRKKCWGPGPGAGPGAGPGFGPGAGPWRRNFNQM